MRSIAAAASRRGCRVGGENLFDGEWRLFLKTGELWDARDLPNESVADVEERAAAEAKRVLEAIGNTITETGNRPPVPFPLRD